MKDDSADPQPSSATPDRIAISLDPVEALRALLRVDPDAPPAKRQPDRPPAPKGSDAP